jgi:hypothetical protein
MAEVPPRSIIATPAAPASRSALAGGAGAPFAAENSLRQPASPPFRPQCPRLGARGGHTSRFEAKGGCPSGRIFAPPARLRGAFWGSREEAPG